MEIPTFEHRCPAVAPPEFPDGAPNPKAGRENCKVRQIWPAGGTEAASCVNCGWTPGIPWQIEMATKMGVIQNQEEVTPLTPLPSAVLPFNAPAESATGTKRVRTKRARSKPSEKPASSPEGDQNESPDTAEGD